MLNENVMQDENELWNEASNPPEKTYDLFGKVEIKAWRCAFEKGTKGGVTFDPARHQKSHIMIDIYIQPLAEINVKYPKSLEFHDVTWSDPWVKIVNPSIKALGIDNVKEINDRWVRVAHVPDGRAYQRKDASGNLMVKPDGTPDMVETTTFKFVKLFANEDECRAEYASVGGNANTNGNGHVTQAGAQPASQEDHNRKVMHGFLTVIVTNAVRGTTDWNTAYAAVANTLPQHTEVAKYFTVDSPETLQMITDLTGFLPF